MKNDLFVEAKIVKKNAAALQRTTMKHNVAKSFSKKIQTPTISQDIL